jgi:hypothetical protein
MTMADKAQQSQPTPPKPAPPKPGSVPKLPQTIFNLEKRGGPTGAPGQRRPPRGRG